MDYSNISSEDDTLFAEKLVREFKIAAIPISVFYSDDYDPKCLRFCFAKEDETIRKACEILRPI